MAWYYVKNGGTASGDGGRYTTEKASDTWANNFAATSEYYNDVTDALNATTAPTHGDFIVVSHLSSGAQAANLSFFGPTSAGGGVTIVSVDDADNQQPKYGAQEDNNAGFDISCNGYLNFHGMHLICGDDFRPSTTVSGVQFNSSRIELAGSGDRIVAFQDGAGAFFSDTTIEFNNANNYISMGFGCKLDFFGGKVEYSPGIDDLMWGGFTSGGGCVEFTGTDLSDVDGYILGQAGASATTEDNIEIRLEGCQMNASLTDWVEEAFTDVNMKFEAVRCAATAAEAEHQYYLKTMYGEAEDQDDSGIHRDETVAFPDSGTKISLKIDTTSYVSKGTPFRTCVPARWCELSSASSDTVRIYLASTTTLHTDDVWAMVRYPDGTNKHMFTVATSAPSESTTYPSCDPLRTSTTELTDDSGGSTWKNGASDLTGYNEYYIDVDTSGDPGADSVPIIELYVGVPSITVYIDPMVDTVA